MGDKILKTYINGFDQEIGGGILAGHVVLLSGVPGSLKTTIAYNMAYKNAKNDGLKVLYITLDKNKEKFMNQILKFGWDDAGGKVNVFDITTIRSNLSHFKGVNWWEPFRTYVTEFKYSFDFNLIIIDSLQMLDLVVKIVDIKTETHNIFRWIADDLKVTGILISEMPFDSMKFSRYDEDILADGIIHLSMDDTESGIERRIRCVKMSGVPHNSNYFRLALRNNELWAERTGTKKPSSPLIPTVSTSDSYSF